MNIIQRTKEKGEVYGRIIMTWGLRPREVTIFYTPKLILRNTFEKYSGMRTPINSIVIQKLENFVFHKY